MTLEEFKSEARSLTINYLQAVNAMVEDTKTKPELKVKLIHTAQSLTLYVQDELESISTDSEDSIAED